MNIRSKKNKAFTLAEVLITLGVIGVVAAVTMPTLVTNIQERVRKEQVRTVKYKITKATEKMNSLGKIEAYPTTMDFVNELKKHMTIAKICKNNELDKCWPSNEINAYSGSGTTLTSYSPKNLTTGQSLKALALSTKSTQTVGIVTGDGVPMLMVYSPRCSGFDEAKTYTWSVEDGKPVTNATTNCISAIFDINGSKGPNKIGTDVRTLNSLFGSTDLGEQTGLTITECNAIKNKYEINECGGVENDVWAASIKACGILGLHLPDMITLANIANAAYGTTQIGTYTIYLTESFNKYGTDCENIIKNYYKNFPYYLSESDYLICGIKNLNTDNSSIDIRGDFWAGNEISATDAYLRDIRDDHTKWNKTSKNTAGNKALCVGD